MNKFQSAAEMLDALAVNYNEPVSPENTEPSVE